MIKLLAYLLGKGTVTAKSLFPDLEEGVRGLPKLTSAACDGKECNACVGLCPTDAIEIKGQGSTSKVSLDLGACIACGLCVAHCPTGTIANNPSTKTARLSSEDLVLSNVSSLSDAGDPQSGLIKADGIFKRSIHLRVVSTGCSACDLEIGACGNPIFDMERMGVHVVASPRFADALLVTGPVPKAMHDPLRRCYEAMAEPRLVIAVGTCAISGGGHKDGYTEANGANAVVPVDVFIPGCPPHPWSIIYGVHLAMTARQAKKKLAQAAAPKADEDPAAQKVASSAASEP